MSASLIVLLDTIIKPRIKEENNGVLSPEYLLYKMIDHSDAFKSIIAITKTHKRDLKTSLKRILDQNKKEASPHDSPYQENKTFEKILQRTIMKKLNVHEKEFDEIDLLITIIETAHLPAQQALRESNIDLQTIIDFDNKRNRKEGVTEDTGAGQSHEVTASKLIKSFVVDLTEQAEQGKLEAMVGRIDEVDRIEQVLARRKKNNPILVGDAGVGKTAIVEGLAQKIASGDIHESLKGYRLLSLDVAGLVAGTKYRGDLEAKLKQLIEYISNSKNILFIDEIHAIINTGKSEGGVELGNTLKPYLSSGKIKCIGATTSEEYRQIFERNAALSRRFNKIDVEALSPEATLHVLKQIRGQYEDDHGVTYTDEAITSIVNLCDRFLHNKNFPDKAIDVLDETGAFAKLRRADKVVDVDLVEQVISEMAHQPVKEAKGSEREQLRNLEAEIKKGLFGQDKAVSAVVDSIILSKSGFNSKNRTIGSYLFVGPTGVGKTELAKQLADKMHMELIRFDMSEYMESHSVSKLIGSPPGYVGHNEGGQLTERVNKNPYCVLLLDEIEKAHPDVYNVFLQVMDNGFATDSQGRKVDFRNTILLMTSNAGVKLSAQEKNGIGFISASKNTEKSLINMDLINKNFTPEFRNRLDAIVEFKAIDRNMIESIVHKNLAPIHDEMAKKGYSLVVDNDVLQEISKKGYVPEMGARPVARVVKDLIALPLAKLVIFEDLQEHAIITASMNEGKVELTVSYPQAPKKPRTRKKAVTE